MVAAQSERRLVDPRHIENLEAQVLLLALREVQLAEVKLAGVTLSKLTELHDSYGAIADQKTEGEEIVKAADAQHLVKKRIFKKAFEVLNPRTCDIGED